MNASNERNSEKMMTWVVIGLVGAQLLGVDVKGIIAALAGIHQSLDAATGGQASNALAGEISLPALAGVYIWNRTRLKAEKIKAEGITAAIDGVIGGAKNDQP